jgi:hypothetical protein
MQWREQGLKDFRLMLEQARAAVQELPLASVYAQMVEGRVQHGERYRGPQQRTIARRCSL